MPADEKDYTPAIETTVDTGEAGASTPRPRAGKWGRYRIGIKATPLSRRMYEYAEHTGAKIESMKWISRISSEELLESTEHEKTRELISDKLEGMAKKQDIIDANERLIGELERQIAQLKFQLAESMTEVAKAKELDESTKRMCDIIRSEGETVRSALTSELADLRKYISKFAPYRRFFRVTFGFFFFFISAALANVVFRLKVIEPFWNAVGIAITSAMLLVIYFGMKENKESSNSEYDQP